MVQEKENTPFKKLVALIRQKAKEAGIKVEIVEMGHCPYCDIELGKDKYATINILKISKEK